MNDIKFTCPSCGQRIQCDASHADRRINCPTCHEDIHIPKKPETVAKPGAHARTAEHPPSPNTVAPAGAREQSAARAHPPGKPQPSDDTVVVPREAVAEAKPARAHAHGEQRAADDGAQGKPPLPAKPVAVPVAPAQAAQPQAAPDHFLCPVCHSELRAPRQVQPPAPNQRPPTAALVRKGTAQPAVPVKAAAPAQPAQPSQGPAQSTPATGATPASKAGGPMKPRMDYLLTGKPPSKTAYAAPGTSEAPASAEDSAKPSEQHDS